MKVLSWAGPVAAAFLVYAPTLGHGFVWDDPIIVEKQLSAFGSLGEVLLPDPRIEQISHLYYRPFVFLTLLLDRALGGGSPLPFHFSSVAIHCMVTGLVSWLAEKLFRSPVATLAAGLLFALHPIHIEAVAWIAGRTDALATLWSVAMLLCIVEARRRRQWGFAALGAFSCLLALMSKEAAVAMLAVAPLLDLWLLRMPQPEASPPTVVHNAKARRKARKRGQSESPPPQGSSSPWAIAGVLYGGMAAATVAYVTLRSMALPGEIVASEGVTGPFVAASRLVEAVGVYTGRLFAPFPMNAFMSQRPVGLVQDLVAITASLAVAGLAGWLIWRKRWLPLGLLGGVYLTLAPSLAIVVFKISETPYAERYLYLPSVFFCLLAGWAAREAWNWRPSLRPSLLGGGGVAVVACVGLTLYGGQVWANDYAFWEYHHALNPNAALPRLHWGTALVQAGRLDEAEAQLKVALELEYDAEGCSKVCNNLAGIAFQRQDFEAAEEWCRRSLEHKPDNASALYHLGILRLMAASGESPDRAALSDAKGHFRKALDSNPYYHLAHFGLGRAQAALGETAAARQSFRQCIAYGPGTPEAREAQALLARLP